MNWVTVSVFTAGAILYGYYGAQDLWRTLSMRRLARRLGFVYLRQRLPEALSLYGTPFALRRFTWNVMEGECNKRRVVVFDCQEGEDKKSWRRTVVAVRTGSTAWSAPMFMSDMRADSSGGWTILYYPPERKIGLTSLKVLRAHLNSM
jgi:hypothetical protein